MDDFDDEMRQLMHRAPVAPRDVDEVLGTIHRRVRRRRQRRAVLGSAAAVAVLAGAGFVAVPLLAPGSDAAHSPQPARDPSAPDGDAAAPPAGPRVLSFSAVSGDDQWVLTDQGCGDASCATVSRTVDGGSTWETVGSPGGPSDVGLAGAQVRFASVDKGWVFTPGHDSLWVTDDGGETWADLPAPTDAGVEQLEARGGSLYASQGDQLWVTPIGGGEWVPVEIGADLDAIESIVVANGVIGLVGRSDGRPVLALSVQEGPWTERDNPCDGGELRLSTTQWALWANCVDGGRSSMWVSDNHAGSWTKVLGGLEPSDLGFGRDTSSGFVAGPSYGLATVTAGSDQPPQATSTISEAVWGGCTNPSRCYVLTGQGRLWATRDGGLTWGPAGP